MCQAIRDGGKRCPIHRHDTQAFLQSLKNDESCGGYPLDFYQRVLSDTRRNHRNVSLGKNETRKLYARLAERVSQFSKKNPAYPGTGDSEPMDETTVASLTALSPNSQWTKPLDTHIARASVDGDLAKGKATFSYIYNHLNDFPAPSKDDLDKVTESLPQFEDKKTRHALAIMQNGALYETLTHKSEETPTLPPLQMQGSQSLSKISYTPQGKDGTPSHLQVTLKDEGNTVLAFKNVPESEWKALESGGLVADEAFNRVRRNPTYRYATMEEEVLGRHRQGSRCPICGRFIGVAAHSCPRKVDTEVTPKRLASKLRTKPQKYSRDIESYRAEGNGGGSRYVIPAEAITRNPGLIDSARFDAISPRDTLRHNNSQDNYIPGYDYDHSHSIHVRRSAKDDILFAGDYHDDFFKDFAHPDELIFSLKMQTRGKYKRDVHVGDTVVVIIHRRESLTLHYLIPHDGPSKYLLAAADENGYTLQAHGAVDETTLDDVPVLDEREKAYYLAYADDDPLDTILNPVNTSALVYGGASDNADVWRIPTSRLRDIEDDLNSGKDVHIMYEHEMYASRPFVDSYSYEVEPGDPEYGGQVMVTGGATIYKDAQGIIQLQNGWRPGEESSRRFSCDCGRDYPCSHMAYSQRLIPQVVHNSLSNQQGEFQEEGDYIVYAGNQRAIKQDAVVRGDRGERKWNVVGEDRLKTSEDYAAMYHEVDSLQAPHEATMARVTREMSVGGTILIPMSYTALRTNYRTMVKDGLKAYIEDRHIASMALPASSTSAADVEGYIEVRKEEDGTFSVVRERTLRCNCDVYRRNYSCVHTRRGALMATSMAEQQGMVSEVVAQMREEVEEGGSWKKYAALNAAALSIQEREHSHGNSISLEEAQHLLEEEVRSPDIAMLRSGARTLAKQIERERKREEEFAAAYAGYEEQREKVGERLSHFEGTPSSDDPRRFNRVMSEARAAHARGDEVFTYEYENVLNGISSPDSDFSRGFGVEIEFDFPRADDWNNESGEEVDAENAIQGILADLKAEGLNESGIFGSHSHGKNTGWVEWSVEEDMSVAGGGEIVSPPLYDTPETWKNLEKVCEILKRHGAVVSYETGSHVHVGSGSYGRSVPKHSALLSKVVENEDLLYRLSTNPQTGEHRNASIGYEFCTPNIAPKGAMKSNMGAQSNSQQFQRRMGAALNTGFTERENMVNITESGQTDIRKNHIEFRSYDGTLDPRIIQQQIKISVALTEWADQEESSADGWRGYDESRGQRLGYNIRGNSRGNKGSEGVRALADDLFPREKDRDDLARLFAITQWQEGEPDFSDEEW